MISHYSFVHLAWKSKNGFSVDFVVNSDVKLKSPNIFENACITESASTVAIPDYVAQR